MSINPTGIPRGIMDMYARSIVESREKIMRVENEKYVLRQGDGNPNWHYMVFDKESGSMVSHVPCAKKLTEREAREIIDGLDDRLEILFNAYR